MLSLAVQKIDKETKPTNMSKQTKGGLQERKKSVDQTILVHLVMDLIERID